jgi:hypothetical protein
VGGDSRRAELANRNSGQAVQVIASFKKEGGIVAALAE